MGEGLHFYKVHGKYFLTSAWFLDEMRMPVARADRLEGPWEVNQDVSRGEDFGLGLGYRVANRELPFRLTPPDDSKAGRNAIHQGGLVDTPTGEWWGFSMMDANSVGRLTALSPITWTDGWPYFGLPGNLGRTPRTWIKPNTGSIEPPHAPYARSDDFSGDRLQPIWQWNHLPVDDKWSLRERPGFLRLHAMAAPDLWHARNTLTQRAIGPRSTVTTVLDASGLERGDVAGLALFNRPYAWLGVQPADDGLTLIQFDEVNGRTDQATVKSARVWLRADCDFLKNTATFRYSTDGRTYSAIGGSHVMAYGLITFQGVRYSLFAYRTATEGKGGFADFDGIDVAEQPKPTIPYGKRIHLSRDGSGTHLTFDGVDAFTVIDRGLGRVSLSADGRYVSVDSTRSASLRRGNPSDAETFQWMETFDGDLILLSIATKRYLRIDSTGRILADAPGPRPDRSDGVRFRWLALE
jgi:beta-xylosidase